MQSGTAWRPAQDGDPATTIERLATIIGRATVALAEVSADGMFRLVNEELCRTLGRPPEVLLGSGLSDISAGDEFAPLKAALERVSHGAEDRVIIEHRCYSPEGRAVWIRCVLTHLAKNGVPGSVLVEATDISARKQAEEALSESRERGQRLERQRNALEDQRDAQERARRESEKRLQFALDAARMGTWFWLPHEDIVTLDATAVRVLDSDPASGHTFANALEKHLAAESVEKCKACLDRILRAGIPDDVFEVELRWKRSDGRLIWVQMTGQAHFEGTAETRRVTAVHGTVVDITERKCNQEALAEASRQKDRFLAMLAHELRNPLAPLAYAVELLRVELTPELDWSRGVIERQVRHLTRLIDDLLDVSRIDRDRLAVQRERLPIADVLAAALEASRPTLQAASQQLDVEQPAEPVYVYGDFVRLTQVLTNLLENAAKFSLAPGRVRISVRRSAEEVVIAVRDSGVGIPREELARVFDMFYQSKASTAHMRGGLGIGLYLVRRLVELHGGRVEARSQGHGHGSEFLVTLPTLPAESDGPAEDETEEGVRKQGTRLRVLIVDDNKDSADALAKLLQGGGHRTEVRYDGESAFAAAEALRPDVVLLDLGMPQVDGYEVCRRIRARSWGRRTRIVALTGWGRPEDRERTRAGGFDDHLVKPVEIGALEAVLRPRAADQK
jgi:PAS domain S-box-containing protein